MKKLIFIIPFIFLLSLFSASAINCAFITPAANGATLQAGSIINITFSNGGLATTDEIISLIINASSPSTRNSSALTRIIANQSNLTGAVLMASSSINLSLPVQSFDWIEDSNDYTLTASVENSTARVDCNATRTSVILDRTTPSIATGITYTSPVRDTNTITATINAVNSNRCYIKFGGNPLTLMTRSGTNNSLCTYTAARGTNNPADGDYPFIIKADDRSNSTDTSIRYVTIDADQSGDSGYLSNAVVQVVQTSDGRQSILGGGQANPFLPKKKNNDNMIILMVVVFLAFLYLRKK